MFNSTLAGRWYPADKESLKKEIDSLFEGMDVRPSANINALILPHAGYQYSGRTAAMGLASLGRQYKRIVVIGPSHYIAMTDILSVPKEAIYKTPIGEVEFDTEFIKKLLQYPIFQPVEQANYLEHSTQIQVPLLQRTQKDFKLVLIVAGQCSSETISRAAAILANLVDDDTLVIASSDFTHYGPNYDYVPFRENVPAQIKDLDMGAYKYIEELDGEGFLKYKEKTDVTICGYIPISILLSMLDKQTTKATLIKYTTSGEITGDYTNSVSYISVGFAGKWLKSNIKIQKDDENKTTKLTEEDKKQLLDLARKSIIYFLDNRKLISVSDENFSERLKATRAAFVTLNKRHQLRGCIGEIFPRQPLYKSVISNAVNAAVRDPRFFPVSKEELNEITIEISALTPPKPVSSYKDIRIGIDGVVLEKDGYSAVFLPQVAPEQNWGLEEMLMHLSLKAGLPPDGWKEGASFLVFQAEVFSEEEK